MLANKLVSAVRDMIVLSENINYYPHVTNKETEGGEWFIKGHSHYVAA